jgi:methionine-rich copper-binding protein CopC
MRPAFHNGPAFHKGPAFPIRLAAHLSLAALITFAVGPALAHAILVDSTPAPRAHIKPGELAISLRYNSRIDAGRSKLTLTAPDQTIQRLPVSAGAGDAVMQAASHVAPGDYLLRWQVLALDGHITRGEVPFTVDKP